MLLAFPAARTCCPLMFCLVSTKTYRSLSTKLLPSPYRCMGFFLSRNRALHLSTFIRLLLAPSCSLSTSSKCSPVLKSVSWTPNWGDTSKPHKQELLSFYCLFQVCPKIDHCSGAVVTRLQAKTDSLNLIIKTAFYPLSTFIQTIMSYCCSLTQQTSKQHAAVCSHPTLPSAIEEKKNQKSRTCDLNLFTKIKKRKIVTTTYIYI